MPPCSPPKRAGRPKKVKTSGMPEGATQHVPRYTEERVDLLAVVWLRQSLASHAIELPDMRGGDGKNVSQRNQAAIQALDKILREVDPNGILRVPMSPSKWDSAGDQRLFAWFGAQGIHRMVRHTLYRRYFHDVDMVNAFPTLLYYYCVNHARASILVPFTGALKEYLDNRDVCLAAFMAMSYTRDDAKRHYLMVMFGSKVDPEGKKAADGTGTMKPWPEHFVRFITELRQLQSLVKDLEPTLVADAQRTYENKKKAKAEGVTDEEVDEACNLKGSVFSRIGCQLERACLEIIRGVFVRGGVVPSTDMFDGVFLPRDGLTPARLEVLLRVAEEEVLRVKRIPIKLLVKPMDEGFEIPANPFPMYKDGRELSFPCSVDDVAPLVQLVRSNSIVEMGVRTAEAMRLCGGYVKATGTFFFLRRVADGAISDDDPNERYYYTFVQMDPCAQKSNVLNGVQWHSQYFNHFKNEWTRKGLAQLWTECIQYMPQDLQPTSEVVVSEPRIHPQPPTVMEFNLAGCGIRAQPYDDDVEIDMALLQPFLWHQKHIICGRADDPQAASDFSDEYWWQVCAGHQTGLFVILMGGFGTGKNIYIEFLHKYVLGKESSLAVTGCDRLLADFNAPLQGKVHVVANEAASADSTPGGWHNKAQRMKAIVTEPTIMIEAKHKDAVSVRNSINVMTLTNCLRPTAGEKDRRTLYFETANPADVVPADELPTYFDRLVADTYNMHVARTYITYLKRRFGGSRFRNLQPLKPRTRALLDFTDASKPAWEGYSDLLDEAFEQELGPLRDLNPDVPLIVLLRRTQAFRQTSGYDLDKLFGIHIDTRVLQENPEGRQITVHMTCSGAYDLFKRYCAETNQAAYKQPTFSHDFQTRWTVTKIGAVKYYKTALSHYMKTYTMARISQQDLDDINAAAAAEAEAAAARTAAQTAAMDAYTAKTAEYK